jgi:glyoxylate/hydroxypyruvate reductase
MFPDRDFMPTDKPIIAVFSTSAVTGPFWLAELAKAAPDFEVQRWPDITAPERVVAAALWHPPEDLFRDMPNLRVIQSFGAGVDHLWKLGDALPDVPVLRLVDPVMTDRLAAYVLWGAVMFQRRFHRYLAQQQARVWEVHGHPEPAQTTVGLLGLGVIGRACAELLRAHGFKVAGWSRSPKVLPGIGCHYGLDGLPDLVGSADILVNVLPLTAETRCILDERLFAWLRRGSFLINAGRGEHVVSADVLAALEDGTLEAALLDVFPHEPLPEEDPLWAHPRVIVTPHAAAISNPASAAGPIIDGIRAVLRGERPENLAEPGLGY